MEDVHGFESRFKSLVKNIRSSNISDRNKELLLRFADECFSNGISVARVVKCLHMLKKVAELLAKDFDKCDKDDIKALVAKLERSKYSVWTKHDYKAILKKFYSGSGARMNIQKRSSGSRPRLEATTKSFRKSY